METGCDMIRVENLSMEVNLSLEEKLSMEENLSLEEISWCWISPGRRSLMKFIIVSAVFWMKEMWIT